MGWRLEIARSEPFSRTKHDLKPGSWADTAFPRGQVNDPSFWGAGGRKGFLLPGRVRQPQAQASQTWKKPAQLCRHRDPATVQRAGAKVSVAEEAVGKLLASRYKAKF